MTGIAANAGTDRSHPPRVALCCTVGVTGHRPDILNGAGEDHAAARIAAVLADIKNAIGAIAQAEARWFLPRKPALRFVSPLAPGADQIAAQAALDAGYALSVIMPFAQSVYAEDFDASLREGYESLLAQADGVLELPGRRERALDAYVMAGRATVAHAELMIAVWDGRPARGRGGTGEVVDLALRRGKPVIHLPIDPDAPPRLIWGGLDPLVAPTQTADAAARDYDAGLLDLVMGRLFAPPDIAQERDQLATFLDEPERTVHPRIEYPLLLAATGVRPIRRSAWRVSSYADQPCPEWAPYHAATASDRLNHGSNVAALEEQYVWADRLAQHYAQTYRSGHVLNFVLAAAAVVLALGGLLVPGGKLLLTFVELLLIAAIVINTREGGRAEWHRRWLDYRHLAEQLRPMRSLKLFAVAQPAPGGVTEQRWIDWFAAAAWRMIEIPVGVIEPGDLGAMGSVLVAEELRPQIDYHRAAARQLHQLDHRLHRIGGALFAMTIATCAIVILGYGLIHEWILAHTTLFVALSAGLPALGGAIFGIRVQGDFEGTAERSLATADRLELLADLVARENRDMARAGDLVEAASQTMLAELGEWRVSYSRRKLVIPA